MKGRAMQKVPWVNVEKPLASTVIGVLVVGHERNDACEGKKIGKMRECNEIGNIITHSTYCFMYGYG